MSPARFSFGGSHRRQLNSVLPAAVNGCGTIGVDGLTREYLHGLAIIVSQGVVR
jgi:hypothetical protein